jgi:hypothetical protein
MHDVNPLGPMMHLRELDRQAAPRLRSLRPGRQGATRLAALGAMMITLLRRLDPTAILQGVKGTETLRRRVRQPPVTDHP